MLSYLNSFQFSGSCKIEPFMIGTAKEPHCFRDGQPQIPYYHQKNAWVDKAIYKKWWDDVFLPQVRAFTDEPVALLMDNFSGHDDIGCIDPRGQVIILIILCY